MPERKDLLSLYIEALDKSKSEEQGQKPDQLTETLLTWLPGPKQPEIQQQEPKTETKTE